FLPAAMAPRCVPACLAKRAGPPAHAGVRAVQQRPRARRRARARPIAAGYARLGARAQPQAARLPSPLPRRRRAAVVDCNEFCCQTSRTASGASREQEKMRVVDAIAQWFEVASFKHYFGYAGGAVWPFLDALTDKPQIEGIQAKHESHAVHMADLYHRV